MLTVARRSVLLTFHESGPVWRGFKFPREHKDWNGGMEVQIHLVLERWGVQRKNISGWCDAPISGRAPMSSVDHANLQGQYYDLGLLVSWPVWVLKYYMPQKIEASWQLDFFLFIYLFFLISVIKCIYCCKKKKNCDFYYSIFYAYF